MPHHRRILPGLFLLCVVLAPATAHAQIFTPTYLAPRSSADIGIYFSDLGDIAVEGVVRRNYGNYDLGFRGGIADVGNAAILLGADFRNPIQIDAPPLDLALVAGAQGVIGDFTGGGAHLGVSLGGTFAPAEATFTLTPYLVPRVAFVAVEDASDLEVLADLGIDADFAPNVSFRLNFGISDRGSNFGIGVALR